MTDEEITATQKEYKRKLSLLSWKSSYKGNQSHKEKADLGDIDYALKGWTIERIHDDDATSPLQDYDVAWSIRFNRQHNERPYGTDDGYDGPLMMLENLAYSSSLRNGRDLGDQYEKLRERDKIKHMEYEEYLVRYIQQNYLITSLSVGYQCQSISIQSGADFRDGAAYISKSEVGEEWGSEEQAWKYLEAVIKEASDYQEGDCWGVRVTRPDGVEYEALWGCIGWDDNGADFVFGNGLVPDAERAHKEMVKHGHKCAACPDYTWNENTTEFYDGPFRMYGALCNECRDKKDKGEPLSIPGFALSVQYSIAQLEMVI